MFISIVENFVVYVFYEKNIRVWKASNLAVFLFYQKNCARISEKNFSLFPVTNIFNRYKYQKRLVLSCEFKEAYYNTETNRKWIKLSPLQYWRCKF